MEIILINESKLKIMLEKEDLYEFEISAEELDYSNTETKRMFWDLLNKAKRQTGFDTDGQRVLVQLYPSRDGGCEMFITKVGNLGSENALGDSADISVIHPKRAKKAPPRKKVIRAFGFERTEWLMSVCKRLHSIGYSGESTAYTSEDGRCYLMLSAADIDTPLILDEYSFITEYGTYENTENLKYYLGEHGKILCRNNAVSRLGAL